MICLNSVSISQKNGLNHYNALKRKTGKCVCVRFSKKFVCCGEFGFGTVSFHHKRELILGLERSDPTTSYINTCFDVWTASSPNNNWFSSRAFSHHTKPSKNVQSTFTQVFRELEHVFTLPKNKRVLILSSVLRGVLRVQ